MINNVVLVGRLTRDVELKYTGGSTAVVSFTIAVNRPFTKQTGEREADFINCVAWRKTAELIAQYTRKGSMVGVEGRIQTRSYDNQQGQKIYVTETVVDKVTFLDGKQTDNSKENKSTTNYSSNHQSAPPVKNEPDNSNSNGIEINDDDFPF